MNLAGNALKFTRRGRVEIAVEHVDDMLRFRVSDTGIGIPTERIGRLFTEFQQADGTIAREFGGTGLGLSITKKFVEMHGGHGSRARSGPGPPFFSRSRCAWRRKQADEREDHPLHRGQ